MSASTATVTDSQQPAHTEPFAPEKLSRSIHAACLSVNLPDGLAEDTARHTCKAVELWLATKSEVTTDDIRRKAAQALAIVSPEASYLYKHHHHIL